MYPLNGLKNNQKRNIMTVKETYPFVPNNFINNGLHKFKSTILFIDFIRESEKHFHSKHNPLYANTLSANTKTLRILNACFNESENTIHGMESVAGEFDIEMNMKIADYSENEMVFAIERFDDDDEPLFLISDDDYADGSFVLQYISDDDENGSEKIPNPQLKEPVPLLRDCIA